MHTTDDDRGSHSMHCSPKKEPVQARNGPERLVAVGHAAFDMLPFNISGI